MAVYEYNCEKCKKVHEITQKMCDPVLTECPKCGEKEGFCKLVSLSSVQYKGTGWYVTDYKGKK